MSENEEFEKLFGPGAAKNPDNVLEQSIGEYDRVMVIGIDKQGNLRVRGSTNAKMNEFLWMMEKLKFWMMTQ